MYVVKRKFLSQHQILGGLTSDVAVSLGNYKETINT